MLSEVCEGIATVSTSGAWPNTDMISAPMLFPLLSAVSLFLICAVAKVSVSLSTTSIYEARDTVMPLATTAGASKVRVLPAITTALGSRVMVSLPMAILASGKVASFILKDRAVVTDGILMVLDPAMAYGGPRERGIPDIVTGSRLRNKVVPLIEKPVGAAV